jgi:ABC-2 type transport system ATP-binding protein
MASSFIFELEGLSVSLGGRSILKSLNGSLSGRAVGLLGPNGSGKSTLINTLLGFHSPEKGTARVLGHDIRKEANAVRHVVGYMPESDSFISHMNGITFVRYMAELAGLPANQALERAHEAFFYVGLGEARYRKVGTYSLGMKQLAKLAQAIAHGPKLLFLDEPTNGLDPPARARMLQLVKEMKASGSLRILLSSHLLRDVEEVCDEVLILKDGEIAAQCDLEAERKANKKFLELETANAGTEFTSAVEQLGCECAWFTNGRAKLVLPEQVEIRELYQIAERTNVQIRRMNHRRDSLEDIFLKAMEKPERQEAAHGRI